MTCRVLFFLFLFCVEFDLSGQIVSHSGQTKKLSEKQLPSARTRVVLDSIASAPVEIKVEIVLRLLSRGDITREFAKPILVELFYQADQAESKIPVEGAISQTLHVGDSDAWFQISASRLGLNKLSIQCRLVQELLAIDLQLATDLFDTLQPVIPAQSCRSAVRPDLKLYYSVLTKVYQRKFAGVARKQGEDIAWLASKASISSVVQIALLLRVLQRLALSDESRNQILHSISGAMEALPYDDRSFSSVFEITTAALAGDQQSAGITDPAQLSLRANWVRLALRAINQTRCAENADKESIRRQLERLRPLAGEQERLLFPETIPIPRSELEKAEFFSYWMPDAGGSLMDELKRLRFGPLEGVRNELPFPNSLDPQKNEIPEELRNSSAWREACTKLLISMDKWSTSTQLEKRHRFVILADLYGELLALIPETDHVTMAATLNAALATMKDQSIRREMPSLWMLKWQQLVEGFSERTKRLPLLRAATISSGDDVMVALFDVMDTSNESKQRR